MIGKRQNADEEFVEAVLDSTYAIGASNCGLLRHLYVPCAKAKRNGEAKPGCPLSSHTHANANLPTFETRCMLS